MASSGALLAFTRSPCTFKQAETEKKTWKRDASMIERYVSPKWKHLLAREIKRPMRMPWYSERKPRAMLTTDSVYVASRGRPARSV